MYKGYLIDLDGTVYRGKERIPSAEIFVKKLQERGIPHLFVTNNATKTPQEVAHFLTNHCQLEVHADEVYTSGMAAVDYVREHYPQARTLIVGEKALRQQAAAAGLPVVDEEVEVVIQALNREATYATLEKASTAIRNGAVFITTNADTNIPTERGFLPGSGALTAFLKTSTQKNPVIIGKPYAPIMEGALKRIGLTKQEVVMVGDNYNTDILAGIHYGMDTLLTLTGFTRREDLVGKDELPTHIVEDLSGWVL